MIRQVSLLPIALLCASGASAMDKRIRTVVYDPNEVVRLVGRSGIQSTIEFGPDEVIENVAVGDSAAWQITPNRRASLLFIKPTTGSSRTNMTVVTDRRTYMFDLVTGTKDSVPVYAMKFHYPARARPGAPATPGARVAVAAAPSPAPVAPDRLYFGWVMKGHDRLLPRRAFDDSKSLYLAWSREAPIPAILTLSSDGKEGPVNYRSTGDYIIVDGVPSSIVLRHGKKSATLRRQWPVATQPGQQPARQRSISPPAIATSSEPQPTPSALAEPVQPRAVAAPAIAASASRELTLGSIAREVAARESDSDKLAGLDPTL